MALEWVTTALAAAGAGILAAMGLGGGGVLLLWLGYLGMAQRAAQGINLAFVVPVGLVGLWIHRKEGLVDLHAAWPVILGGLAGVWLGTLAAGWMPEALLRRIFGGAIAAAGIREILRGIRLGRQEGWGLVGKGKEKKKPSV